MATPQHASFSPNEFVNRWLSDLQPAPEDARDMPISQNTVKKSSKPERDVRGGIEAQEEKEKAASRQLPVSGDKHAAQAGQGEQA